MSIRGNRFGRVGASAHWEIPGLEESERDGHYRGPESFATIAEVLSRARSGASGWSRANCPFCVTDFGASDKTMSWGHNAATGRWHCFRCKSWGYYGGDDNLRDWAPPIPGRDTARIPARAELAEGMDWPEGFRSLVGRREGDSVNCPTGRALGYLRKRRVSAEAQDAARLGVCIGGKKYDRRIVAPVIYERALLGFVTRRCDESRFLRYLYAEGMQRGEIIYNREALERGDLPFVVMVEGVFDVLPHWPHAAAFLGKPTDDHFEICLRSKVPLVVCLDGDAWREGQWFAERLAFEGVPAVSLKLPPKSDPGNVSREWLWRAAAHATKVIRDKK